MAATNINSYKIKLSDQFFFDTNIWLLLFGTVANYQKNDQTAYAGFLQELINRNSALYINSMIISEFANVLLRHDFKQWSQNCNISNPEFKRHFSTTNDYKNSVLTVKHLISNILSIPILIKVSDSFHNNDMVSVLRDFETVDFNDAYIANLAKSNSYKIVTNDRDFQKLGNIEILTTQI